MTSRNKPLQFVFTFQFLEDCMNWFIQEPTEAYFAIGNTSWETFLLVLLATKLLYICVKSYGVLDDVEYNFM